MLSTGQAKHFPPLDGYQHLGGKQRPVGSEAANWGACARPQTKTTAKAQRTRRVAPGVAATLSILYICCSWILPAKKRRSISFGLSRDALHASRSWSRGNRNTPRKSRRIQSIKYFISVCMYAWIVCIDFIMLYMCQACIYPLQPVVTFVGTRLEALVVEKRTTEKLAWGFSMLGHRRWQAPYNSYYEHFGLVQFCTCLVFGRVLIACLILHIRSIRGSSTSAIHTSSNPYCVELWASNGLIGSTRNFGTFSGDDHRLRRDTPECAPRGLTMAWACKQNGGIAGFSYIPGTWQSTVGG